MKERTGRSRVSKADQAARKISGEQPEQSSRSRVSKADQVGRKISGEQPEQSGRSRVSKVDQISRKIDSPESQPSNVSARVRPSSKVDEIQKKIPANPVQAAERPVRPDIPQPSARVTPPSSKPNASRGHSGGCCLLPFTLAVLVILGIILLIF